MGRKKESETCSGRQGIFFLLNLYTVVRIIAHNIALLRSARCGNRVLK